MAKPVVHARSSAKKFGGRPEDYVTLHHLMDSSKSAHASVRHRIVFHHNLGARFIGPMTADGDHVTNSDGVAVRVAVLVHQHNVEDLGFEPDLRRYLDAFDRDTDGPARRDLPTLDIDAQCARSARKFGGAPEAYRKVHELMDLPVTESGDVRARAVTHHAFGCFTVETCLGPLIVTAPGRTAHTRDVAEHHILSEFGWIPDLGDWTRALTLQPWMSGSRRVAVACND